MHTEAYNIMCCIMYEHAAAEGMGSLVLIYQATADRIS